MVYGAAQDDRKEEFLNELAYTCSQIHVPYIVGGDFNILRSSEEKNKNLTHSHYTDRFNDVIQSLNLREIHMGGGNYTWSNKQKHPTLEKLDRVLMSFEWEELFPLVSVRKLGRDTSDHNPLLLATDVVKTNPSHDREFRFELSWLKNEDFYIKPKKIWEQPVKSEDPIDILNIKLKHIKKYFKGWGAHSFGHARKRKKYIKEELERIEKMEENGPLGPEIYEERTALCAELNELLITEELFWL